MQNGVRIIKEAALKWTSWHLSATKSARIVKGKEAQNM